MPSLILDPYGRPYAASDALYSPPRQPSGQRIRRPAMAADYDLLLSGYSWRDALSDCRLLAAQGLVSACSIQKWSYVSASGWAPVFTGENSEWGDAAEAALAEADKLASVRGPRFPFAKIFELGGRCWDSDGAFFLNLTQSESGFPQFQPIEAHRIGQRDTGEERVASGPYRGLRIRHGIIYGPAGAEVAYRVLGAAEDGTQDQDVSARDMWHIAPAAHFSEGRPLPLIAPAVVDLFAVTRTRRSQSVQLEIDSKLTLIETTATGRRDGAFDAVNPPALRTPSGHPTEVFEDGMTRTIKSGFDLKPHQTTRPSGEWMAFDDKSLKTAVACMGWRAEMLDPALMHTGAPTRAFQDIINTTIFSAFRELAPYVIRARQYQVAKLIEQGTLERSDEWFRWDTPPPPEFSVDPSRSIASDLDAVRAGAESMPNLQRRWGMTPKAVLTAQARYELLKQEIATRYGVPPDKLGTLAKPGDLPPGTSAPTAPTTP